MSAVSLLEVKNLHVSLPSLAGDIHILKGIDLSVKKGEAIGLTGPSGSGKSTLLMTLAGLELPSSGSVVMNGHCLSDMDEDALARFRQKNIGIVFQSFHLIPTLTAFENVTLPLELAGMAAPRNMGEDYVQKFDAIYPHLAEKYNLIFMPFLLEGVAADPALNQADFIHPNREGVAIMVKNLLPYIDQLTHQLNKKRLRKKM